MSQTTDSRVLATPRRGMSTVGLKALMAVGGLIMVLFLLAHMYGNLKAFSGQQAFDDYSHHLRTLGEPILPYGGALWVIRVVLLAAVISHVVAAILLVRRSLRARGGVSRYRSTKARRGVQRSYASFTLRWGGVVIFLFVIFHLLNLTTHTILPGGATDSPYVALVHTFGNPLCVIAYVLAMLAVGFHLRHGVWSALATLGANVSLRARRNLNVLAYVVAFVVTIGFLLIPFSVLIGVVK